MWWRIDGEKADNGHPKILGFDNMFDRGRRGTTAWTKYEIKMPVPSDAKNINFGVLHPGNGTAWFDTLQVKIDGALCTDSSKFDLDFESDSPRGFYTGGQGYDVAIDKKVFNSLRSTLVRENVAKQPAPVPTQLALSCKVIVHDLEDRRAGMRVDKQGLKELEWVIQNAAHRS